MRGVDMIAKNMDGIGGIESLYKEYYGSLCYYALNYVSDMEVAQDIVQDIFVRLIEFRQRFDTPVHGRNFLYLSVKNACLNYIEHKRSKIKYLRLHREENETELPDKEALIAEVYRKLKKAVDELPPECRKIFYMSYVESQNNETIARELGISVNTVRAQKVRGKQLLREKLKHLYVLVFIFPELFT